MKYRTDFVTNSSSSSFGAAAIGLIATAAGALGLGSGEGEVDEETAAADDTEAGTFGADANGPPDFKYWIETTAEGNSLRTDGSSVWVYAKVLTESDNKGADTEGLTSTIQFSKGGECGDLLSFADYGSRDGYKCVNVAAPMPTNPPSDAATGTAWVRARTRSPAGSISGTEEIYLTIVTKKASLEVATMPAGASELGVGDAPVSLYSRVVVDDPEAGPQTNDEATSSISLTKATGGEWLTLEDSDPVDGWKAWQVGAVNPYGDSDEAAAVQPPEAVSLSLRAKMGAKTLSKNVSFTINAKVDLEIDKPKVSFPSESGATETIRVKVTNPGTGKWALSETADSIAEQICQVSREDGDNGSSWTLTITEADQMEKQSGVGGRYDKGVITLTAVSEGKEVEKEIEIRVLREGLYVDATGADTDGGYVLNADGQSSRLLVFYLYTYDEKSGQLVANTAALAECLLAYKMTEDVLVQNVASVTNLDVKYDSPHGTEGGNFKAWTVRPFPAKGEFVPVGLMMNSPEIDKKSFSVDFTVKLKTPDIGPGSKEWQKELEAISKTIDGVVPENQRRQFYDFINGKKDYLNAEGLRVLHRNILIQAAEMNEAIARGQLSEAEWYDKAIWWCEKAQLMGDVAISALEATFLGPLAGISSGLVRQAVMSAYTAHVEGKSLEQWFDEGLGSVAGIGVEMGLGVITDPDAIEKFIGNSPKYQVLAWSIYFGYNFLNGLYKGMSVWDAAKTTGENFVKRQAVQFLSKRMMATVAIGNQAKALKELEGMTSRDSAGDASLPPQVAERIFREPELVRAIKNEGSEKLKAALENSMRKNVYAPHDTALVGWIKENIPGMAGETEVKVQDFRTPKMDGSTEAVNVNADRDYRVMYKDPDTGAWHELAKEKWEHRSYDEFAKNSGFNEHNSNQKLGIDEAAWEKMSYREKTEAWARTFRQTPTDAAHIVSSRDFSDQVVNPETGKPFTKLDANGNEVPASNIELVKAGRSQLLDPKGMGEMYERKVFDEWQLNGSKSEGVQQLKKGMDELEAVRQGYKEQGIEVESSPEYQRLKEQFDGVRTDVAGKSAVEAVSTRDINKALAHLKNEFSKFAPLGR